MNTTVAIIALIAALNPPRRDAELAGVESTGQVALGASVAVLGYLSAAAVATALLDALDISEPNAQIAAAFVIGIRAVIDVFVPAKSEPLPSRPSLIPLWPVTVPSLLRPEVVVGAIAIGAALGVGPVAGGTAIACFLVVALHRRFSERVGRWAAMTSTVIALALSIDLLVDGVLSV